MLQLFAAFTNGSGRIDPKVGGTFEMFGGNVHGKILEMVCGRYIMHLYGRKIPNKF